MKTLIKLILLTTALAASAREVEFLSLRKELLKIPADYELEYSVRVTDPDKIVTEDNIAMAPNFDISIIKIGGKCKISCVKTDLNPPREMMRACYDGHMFYSLQVLAKTLYVGTNEVRFDPEINGLLKYSPSFVVPTRENLYGKASAGETPLDRIFVIPGAPGGKSFVTLSDPKHDFKLDGIEYGIPKNVVVITLSKEIRNPLHSFKTRNYSGAKSRGWPANADLMESIRLRPCLRVVER